MPLSPLDAMGTHTEAHSPRAAQPRKCSMFQNFPCSSFLPQSKFVLLNLFGILYLGGLASYLKRIRWNWLIQLLVKIYSYECYQSALGCGRIHSLLKLPMLGSMLGPGDTKMDVSLRVASCLQQCAPKGGPWLIDPFSLTS